MPFKSKSQIRKFHTMEARGELTRGTTARWARHTSNIDSLPEYKKQAFNIIEFINLLDKVAEHRPGTTIDNYTYNTIYTRKWDELEKESIIYNEKTAAPDVASSAAPDVAQGKKRYSTFAKILRFPFTHPKTSIFLGGIGLGHFIGKRRKKEDPSIYYNQQPYYR